MGKVCGPHFRSGDSNPQEEFYWHPTDENRLNANFSSGGAACFNYSLMALLPGTHLPMGIISTIMENP